MAAIVITSPSGAQTNPTDTILPFNNGGVFGDSILQQLAPYVLGSLGPSSSASQGMYINNTSGLYQFGDLDGAFSSSYLSIIGGEFSTHSSILMLNVDNEIQMNGLLTAVTAGSPAGLHLKLTINGTKYKIQLLDD